MNGMELRQGRGNEDEKGEGDLINVVWVVDSNKLPFYRAERWHQFHNGLGKKFSAEYREQLKKEVAQTGRLEGTGCPEFPMLTTTVALGQLMK